MLIGFPLLLIPFAIYNIIAFFWAIPLGNRAAAITLRSGASVDISFADIVIAIALFCLFLEILKSARVGVKSFVDHLLTLIVLVGAGAEFVLVKEAGTSTFALLLLMNLIDVIGGLSVARRVARRVVVPVEHEPPPPPRYADPPLDERPHVEPPHVDPQPR